MFFRIFLFSFSQEMVNGWSLNRIESRFDADFHFFEEISENKISLELIKIK
jgi:hypothetical protein